MVSGRVYAAGYPGGTRDNQRWYYCHTQQSGVNGHAASWAVPICEQMLFADDGGGAFVSQYFEGNVTAGGAAGDSTQDVAGYIVPPSPVKKLYYSCTGAVQICYASSATGVSGGQVSTNGSTSTYFNPDSSLFSYTYPGSITPLECQTNTFNVVGTWRAVSFDNYDTLEPVAPWVANTLNTTYPRWQASAGSTNANRTVTAQYQCQITDWDMWGSTPLWTPGPDDLQPEPTPTVSPSQAFTMTPLMPVSNTVDVSIGTPGEPDCNIILAGYAYSGTIFGQYIDISWAPYEVCTQSTDFSLNFLGIDFTGYLLLAIGISSIGIVYRIVRNG